MTRYGWIEIARPLLVEAWSAQRLAIQGKISAWLQCAWSDSYLPASWIIADYGKPVCQCGRPVFWNATCHWKEKFDASQQIGWTQSHSDGSWNAGPRLHHLTSGQGYSSFQVEARWVHWVSHICHFCISKSFSVFSSTLGMLRAWDYFLQWSGWLN